MSEQGTVIAEFPKNQKETLRITLTEFKGHKLLDLRIFYKGSGEELLPGKGVTIRRDLIPELRKALMAAEKADKQEKADKPGRAADPEDTE